MKLKYIIGLWLSAVLMLSCTEGVATKQHKTFGTIKKHAAFLLSGHEAYDTFTDDEVRVIKVTNLNRSGEGSLAWAIAQEGPRIVVFEVGGVIDMAQENLQIENPYLFIAGQTAPSPGITLIRGGIGVHGHDVMIQHINVRPGDCGLPKMSDWEVDGLSTGGAYNVVIDHCSFTWATDENLSASGPRHQGLDKTSRNITFSNCIIAECLYESTHIKGIHSMGTLIHDYCRNIAVIGNLYAHNNQRNPMIKPNAEAFIVNNLIYNSKTLAIHGTWPLQEYVDCPDSMRRAKLTVVGNVFLPGGDTEKNVYMITGKVSAYQKDNKIITTINDKAEDKSRQTVSSDTEELPTPPLMAESYKIIEAGKVPDHVLTYAGSRPVSRDPIDQRIINEVMSGTGKVIDSQDEVGGYPDYPLTQQQLSVPPKQIELWLEQLSERLIHP